MRGAWWLVVAVACGGGDEAETTEPTTPSGAVDCADAAQNPWAGSCLETFYQGCWDPSGACEGTVALTGATTLVWENGATVEVSLDFASDPFDPTAVTDLISSDGTVCATGVSKNDELGCASRTEYTRASDGAVLVFCAQADGAVDLTCPDGSTVSVTAAESEAASSCQYGDAETCTITTPQM